MSQRPDAVTERVLVLLKLDARRLYERIKFRETEYMQIFSMRRTRSHFPEIFQNRYDSIQIQDLKLCPGEVITALDEYYSSVDEMRWFLNHTEDMPASVEDRVSHFIKILDDQIEQVELQINGALGLVNVEEKVLDFNSSEDELSTDGDEFGADVFSDSPELPDVDLPSEAHDE